MADKRALTNKTIALETRLIAAEGKTELIGETPAMLRVKTLVEKIAPTESSVLILAKPEPGRADRWRIHELSKRANRPFVPVNCGALPENLVESELFDTKKVPSLVQTHSQGTH
ncbi:MAG: sigma 54-interacting transcriptional regulator [Planctomycetaceae bacterium]